MLDTSSATRSVVPPAPFRMHMNDANRLFQSNAYQNPNAAGVVHAFSPQHRNTAHQNPNLQQQSNPASQQSIGPVASAAVSAMGQSTHPPGCVLPQLPHGLSNTSQSLAAALFANSPLINDNIKLAAAAAAAVVQSRGKKSHRAEPVPQSGFKGVSWNSRMKAWLAFYVTENGERKSKTFSTRKLGMEEARLQAIVFCKQKQDQRREARKRELHNQHCNNVAVHRGTMGMNNALGRQSSDESMLESPNTMQEQQHVTAQHGFPITPCMGNTPMNGNSVMNSLPPTDCSTNATSSSTTAPHSIEDSEIAYIPIVPIAVELIEKSGLLQPLELSVLPPCQHCNKQPYPFLMIVSEGQEQTYYGSSIMDVTSQNPQSSTVHNGTSPAPSASSNSTSASSDSTTHCEFDESLNDKQHRSSIRIDTNRKTQNTNVQVDMINSSLPPSLPKEEKESSDSHAASVVKADMSDRCLNNSTTSQDASNYMTLNSNPLNGTSTRSQTFKSRQRSRDSVMHNVDLNSSQFKCNSSLNTDYRLMDATMDPNHMISHAKNTNEMLQSDRNECHESILQPQGQTFCANPKSPLRHPSSPSSKCMPSPIMYPAVSEMSRQPPYDSMMSSNYMMMTQPILTPSQSNNTSNVQQQNNKPVSCAPQPSPKPISSPVRAPVFPMHSHNPTWSPTFNTTPAQPRSFQHVQMINVLGGSQAGAVDNGAVCRNNNGQVANNIGGGVGIRVGGVRGSETTPPTAETLPQSTPTITKGDSLKAASPISMFDSTTYHSKSLGHSEGMHKASKP